MFDKHFIGARKYTYFKLEESFISWFFRKYSIMFIHAKLCDIFKITNFRLQMPWPSFKFANISSLQKSMFHFKFWGTLHPPFKKKKQFAFSLVCRNILLSMNIYSKKYDQKLFIRANNLSFLVSFVDKQTFVCLTLDL